MTRRLPFGARLQGSRYVQFGRKTELAVARASKALQSDLRFEHLQKVEDLLEVLAVEARMNSDVDVAAEFSKRNSREVVETVCFIPVHRLNFLEEIQMQDVLFLPTTDPRVPPTDSFREHEGPFKSVAVMEVAGTNYRNMAERAREKAGSVLRLLRTDLIGRSIPPVQLRFRLGTSYTFPSELRGWNSRPDASYDLDLSAASLSDIAMGHYKQLHPMPRDQLHIKADIALRWMERARFTGEPLIEVLYLTFALEALLGDTQEGLKSGLIARRQLMLSHIMTGTIPYPNQTIMLYG